VGTDSAAIFIRQSDIVGANRDKPAIGNLELTMEFNEPFILPPLFGAEASAAEDKNHWMLPLQFGELPVFRGVVGKLIIWEDGPWDDVGPHLKFLNSFIRVGDQAASRHKSMTMSLSGCEQQISTLPSAGASSGSGP
jgi:hypothetical protein